MSGKKRQIGDPAESSWGAASEPGESLPFEVMPPTERSGALSSRRIPSSSRRETEIEDRPSIDEPELPEGIKPPRWEAPDEVTQIDFNDPAMTESASTPTVDTLKDDDKQTPAKRRESSTAATVVPEVVGSKRGIVIGPTDSNWSDESGEAKTIAPGSLIIPPELRRAAALKPVVSVPKELPQAKTIDDADDAPVAKAAPRQAEQTKAPIDDDPPLVFGPPSGGQAEEAPVIVGPPKGRQEAPFIMGPPKGRDAPILGGPPKSGPSRPIEIRETRRKAGQESLDPRMLGPAYRLQREIAVGGMGTVYEAERASDRKRVALKVLNANVAKDARIKERLRREVEASQKIGHRGIVQMFGFETAPDGRAFAVMELLEGAELRERLKAEGKLPPNDACQIAAEVCDVLAAAHAQGVVHRDVKPENIFLSKDASGKTHVKLLDFGAANVLDAKTLTVEGSMIGTPAYMAPEQVLGDEVTERTDVYATAVVLYEALAGQQPFRAERFEETIVRVVSMVPPPPLGVTSIDEVVLKGLEKVSANRWQTAASFAEALRTASAGKASAGAWKLGWSRRLRSKTTQRVATGALVVIVASSIGYLAGDRTQAERLSLAVRPADAAGCAEPETSALRSAMESALVGVSDIELDRSQEVQSGVASLHVVCQKDDKGLRADTILYAATGGREEAHFAVRGSEAASVAPRIAVELASKKGWRTSADLRKQSEDAKVSLE
ncbi:MAG: protein kinase [Deltaproteobacteria bacterium]|nr:protein kinase [Deltaproteobacteria bacterium]